MSLARPVRSCSLPLALHMPLPYIRFCFRSADAFRKARERMMTVRENFVPLRSAPNGHVTTAAGDEDSGDEAYYWFMWRVDSLFSGYLFGFMDTGLRWKMKAKIDRWMLNFA